MAQMTQQALDFESSAFVSMTYDDETNALQVVFKDGARYTYSIPQNVIDAWMSSGSIGAFYNANVRGQFSFQAD